MKKYFEVLFKLLALILFLIVCAYWGFRSHINNEIKYREIYQNEYKTISFTGLVQELIPMDYTGKIRGLSSWVVVKLKLTQCSTNEYYNYDDCSALSIRDSCAWFVQNWEYLDLLSETSVISVNIDGSEKIEYYSFEGDVIFVGDLYYAFRKFALSKYQFWDIMECSEPYEPIIVDQQQKQH